MYLFFQYCVLQDKWNSIYCYEKTNEKIIFFQNLIYWIQTKWKLQSVRRYSLSIVACFFENNIFSLMGKFLLCHGFHICHYVTNVDNNKCVVVIINNYVHFSACKHNLDIDKPLFQNILTSNFYEVPLILISNFSVISLFLSITKYKQD